MQNLFQILIAWGEKLVTLHPGWFLAAFVVFLAVSILSGALPAPEEVYPTKSGSHFFAYRTVYIFLHVIAFNFGRIVPWFRFNPNGK